MTPAETAASGAETREFQTEARQLLDLMIHSVYSHPEIFLRELISNASDALDKLRFEALTNPDLARYTADPHIRLSPDSSARTLTISDNGIGMSREEVVRYIGTIAKSGTKEFASVLQKQKASAAEKGESPELDADLIGQFGVGFYSSFMVADRVEMVTRRAGEEHATRWTSTGDGTYTLDTAERDEPGTTITLHLKPGAKPGEPGEEDEGGTAERDFTAEWTLRDIVRRYSDFVSYPIRMQTERQEVERDEEGKPKEGAEPRKVVEDQTLNSMKAIWTRPQSEVSDEEYNEFYKHVSHDWTEPMRRIVMRAEGAVDFRALLFIPSRAPFDMFLRAPGDTSSRSGIQLYVKRVFIMSDARELIPEWLRFLKGVVDSEDLPLNISREILQQNRQVQAIRKSIVRKVLDTLRSILRDDRETYGKFWNEFGRVVKEGLFQDQGNREAILDVCLFHTTGRDDVQGMTTIDEYIARMKEGQDAIYYLTAPSLSAAAASPHLEAFRAKGYEVLLLVDPVDEVWTQSLYQHKEKRFQSAAKGGAELGSKEEREKEAEERKQKEGELRGLLDTLKGKLDDRVKDVRLSSRLTESPACLVGDAYDTSPQLEALLRAAGQEVPVSKRILELNPDHAIVQKLQSLQKESADEARLKDYAELLYGQALLAEGTTLPDPADFSQRVARLMAQAL